MPPKKEKSTRLLHVIFTNRRLDEEELKKTQNKEYDYLYDGGGTFCGIAAEIRKVRPDVELNIFVTHIVNPKGIENLSRNFDHIWFTNSYKDWVKAWEHQPTPFPANITQIEVI